MEDINIEDYIKDLSPELQEKARACQNPGELIQLAQENKIPIPDEALEAVAGGDFKGPEKPTDPCPGRNNKAPHEIYYDHNWRFCNYYKCRYCPTEFIYRENDKQPNI